MVSSFLTNKFRRELDDRGNIRFKRKYIFSPKLVKRLGFSAELKGHEGCVNCLEWNLSGSLLLSGSDDLRIILWNAEERKKLAVLDTKHAGNIFSVKVIPQTQDSIIVSGAADSRICIHDLNKCTGIQVISSHLGRVKRLATSPDTPYLFWSGAEDGTVQQHDFRCPYSGSFSSVLINLKAHQAATVKSIAINPVFSQLIAVGCSDPFVRLYDRRYITSVPISVLTGPSESCRTEPLPFTKMPSEGVEYYSSSHISNERSNGLIQLAATHVAFSPDGQELLLNLNGEQIYLFNINRKRQPGRYCIPQHVMDSTANAVTSSVQGDKNKNDVLKNENAADESVRSLSPERKRKYECLEIMFAVHVRIFNSSSSPKPILARTGSKLPPQAENMKVKANDLFEKESYDEAIHYYNLAISIYPNSAVLYGNRAAAYLKRLWKGDVYSAFRDCLVALDIDPNHIKAHFRLAKCMFELKWFTEARQCLDCFKARFPEFAKAKACEILDGEIYSKTSAANKETLSKNPLETADDSIVAEELKKRSSSYDHEKRFCGHCNTTTDIKEANFLGDDGAFICAGSDDGSLFIWDKKSTNVVKALRGDSSIVNCVQPHPKLCMLATSGIDSVVRLWEPRPDDGTVDSREVVNSVQAASRNQRRMNENPFDQILISMGYEFEPDEDMQPLSENSFFNCNTS